VKVKNKRNSQRLYASLNAEVLPNGKDQPAGFLDKNSDEGVTWYTLSGIIENLSKEGIFIRVAPSENGINCIPGSRHKITFQLLTKQVLDLHCEVVWSNKILMHPFGSKKEIDPPKEYTLLGMKITIPTQEYRKFYKKRLKQHD
jgi:hypothetical protein